jgi:hypothetical protein
VGRVQGRAWQARVPPQRIQGRSGGGSARSAGGAGPQGGRGVRVAGCGVCVAGCGACGGGCSAGCGVHVASCGARDDRSAGRSAALCSSSTATAQWCGTLEARRIAALHPWPKDGSRCSAAGRQGFAGAAANPSGRQAAPMALAGPTVREYGEQWLLTREHVETVADEAGRLRNHVFPGSATCRCARSARGTSGT